jgi:hypothetical protein
VELVCQHAHKFRNIKLLMIKNCIIEKSLKSMVEKGSSLLDVRRWIRNERCKLLESSD